MAAGAKGASPKVVGCGRGRGGRRRALAAAVSVIAATLAIVAGDGQAAAATLPAGFSDSLVATVSSPTAFAFTPDGRMLVASQTGVLRVVVEGSAPVVALDLSSKVCTERERGLVGVAADPLFASTRAVYAYYTFKKGGDCAFNSSTSPVNRLSRFTLSESNVVDPASEVVLLDNVPSTEGVHLGGDIQFGPDGLLYLTLGDAGCDPAGNSGCYALNDAARDLSLLTGKVARLTRDGAVPAGNPYTGADSARCNTTGRTDATRKCQEIYAFGLRNPWRMAFDPQVAGRAFVNDVGEQTWEEVNALVGGADYGWNVREGACARGSATSCGAAPVGMTNPLYSYQHVSGGCNAITGGAFVPSGLWPSAYEGRYLFSDYTCGKIFSFDPSAGTATEFVTGLGIGSAIALAFGPTPTGRALYYATYANGGELRRIAFVGTANRAPAAVIAATPRWGRTPLTVAFDGGASSDPDGNALTYTWDFGDGSPAATGRTTSHTYALPNTYQASLVVRDTAGAASPPAVVRIDAGNEAPSVQVTSPATSTRFRTGQTIVLDGSATDPEDGAVPAGSLSWSAVLRHDTHTHPFLQPTTGTPVSILAPAPESLDAAETSSLQVALTATDSRGLSQTVTRDVLPNKVAVTFSSEPAGATLTVNGAETATPRTRTSWEGYVLSLEAPATLSVSGGVRSFERWSDGVTARVRTYTTPAAASTVTAIYAIGAPGTSTFEPVGGDADGWLERGSSVYPPATGAATAVDTTSSRLWVRRSKTGFDYQPVANALLRFDTTSLPDDAVVTSARLMVSPTARTATNGLSLVAGWQRAASWPIDGSDWRLAESTGTAAASAGVPLSSIVPGNPLTIDLLNVSAIDPRLATGIRLDLSSAAPTGANDLGIAAGEDPSLAAPRLEVTWSVPTTASFATVAGADDGWLERGSSAYPPSTSATTVDTTSSRLWVRRSKASSTYQPVANALLRFDTSSLPDSAVVVSARLVLAVTNRSSADGRSVVAGWWPSANWPVDGGDWRLSEASGPEAASGGVAMTSIVAGQELSIPLINVGSIRRDSATGIRLDLSGGAPTGANDLGFASGEDPALAAPRLEVTYRP